MDHEKSVRAQLRYKKKARTRANKNVTRLSYNPKKDKEKTIRALRNRMRGKARDHLPRQDFREVKTLHVGSINVNGLDMEASWAVSELLREKEFDVSTELQKKLKIV